MVPTSFIPPVAIRGLEPAVSWLRCDGCGYQSLAHGTTLGYGVAGVVSRKDFSEIKAPIFFVGQPADYHLCMPMKRWRELLGGGKPYWRAKLDFQQLAVIDDSRFAAIEIRSFRLGRR